MEKEKVLLNAVLCFLRRGDEILLARKAYKIGAGLWNGYGGGIESGEMPETAAARELEEESGVSAKPTAFKKIAIVDFHNTKSDGEEFTCRVHMYLVSAWEGEPHETDEMRSPTWFPIKRLPLREMMLADAFWLPQALEKGNVYAEAWYGPHQKELLRSVEVSSL